MALSHFKLANLFSEFIFTYNFHKNLSAATQDEKKIKTCHKNCNTLITDKKIHSRTISDQQSDQRREPRLIRFVSINTTTFSSQ